MGMEWESSAYTFCTQGRTVEATTTQKKGTIYLPVGHRDQLVWKNKRTVPLKASTEFDGVIWRAARRYEMRYAGCIANVFVWFYYYYGSYLIGVCVVYPLFTPSPLFVELNNPLNWRRKKNMYLILMVIGRKRKDIWFRMVRKNFFQKRQTTWDFYADVW